MPNHEPNVTEQRATKATASRGETPANDITYPGVVSDQLTIAHCYLKNVHAPLAVVLIATSVQDGDIDPTHSSAVNEPEEITVSVVGMVKEATITYY